MKTKTVIASTLTAGQSFKDGTVIAKVEPGHHCVKVTKTNGNAFVLGAYDEVDVVA